MKCLDFDLKINKDRKVFALKVVYCQLLEQILVSAQPGYDRCHISHIRIQHI